MGEEYAPHKELLNVDRQMNVIKAAIPDVLILEPKVFGDERVFFELQPQVVSKRR